MPLSSSVLSASGKHPNPITILSLIFKSHDVVKSQFGFLSLFFSLENSMYIIR